MLQIVLYVITFFPDIKQKIVGILIPVAVIAVLSVTAPKTDITVIEQLPGSPSFSEEAELSVEDASFANIQIHSNKDGMLYIKANGYGITVITITDGGKEYRYTLEIYKEDGITRTRITPQQKGARMSKRIEELKELIDRAGKDGDWKGPYDELLRELYNCSVLFFALSKNDFDPDTNTSVPLISTKDFGGLPALYVFSEIGFAGLWLNHYRHVSEDGRYGLIAAVEKGSHGFFSIFKIAKKLGAEMVMLDEGGSYIGIRLDDLLEANGLDPSSIELPLGNKEMLDMLDNKVSPELRFARVPAIPLKGE